MESEISMKKQETSVIVIGAGPSGLATAACLTQNSIPYILLERDNCIAPLWKKKTYDRVHLHLTKKFCELPYLSLPKSLPRYVSRDDYIQYLDDYVKLFHISPLYGRHVELAKYDPIVQRWRVVVRNTELVGSAAGGGVDHHDGKEEEEEEFVGRFLVVATGETADPYCPEIEGLDSFMGKVLHSTEYKIGKEYKDQNVLVVGSGNSGMEIALDLTNHGAHTSLVVRSPVHVLSRDTTSLGLSLLKFVPFNIVDALMVLLSKLTYGDLSKYGIERPKEGPFYMKTKYSKYPIIDVGAIDKIQSGQIQVLPTIVSINGHDVLFENGRSYAFDAIIFATGFHSSTDKWLQGDDYTLNEDGCSKQSRPKHWKDKNGLYCAGFGRKGLYGAGGDAGCIANDIKELLSSYHHPSVGETTDEDSTRT